MPIFLLRHFKRPGLLTQTKCLKFHNQKGISGFINSSREKLRTSLKEYQCDDYNEIYMRAYRLPSLVFGTSFNEAGINVVPLNYDENGNICHPAHVSQRMQTFYKTLKFGKLYNKGLDVLQEYLNTGEVASLYKPSLLCLLHFLDEIEIHEKSLALQSWKQRRYRRESVQPAIIANHLLSKLVANKNYFLDYSHDTGWECTCGSCKDEIKFGNTALGYEEMWFGLTDIILNPEGIGETSVLTPDIRSEMNNDTKGSRFAVECDTYNKSILRRTETVNQSVTQAITFSLYQANKNQKRLTTACDICPPSSLIPTTACDIYPPSSLIPTIVITSNAFDIYMYDYENDVLLRNDGPPINLWTAFEQKLNIISIIQIWLIINHMLFEARLNSSHIDALQKTSDFHNHCGEKLAVFIERVRFLSDIECIFREFSSYEKPLCIDD